MAKIYLRKILAGDITIDDVPDRWKKQVEDLLAEQANANETTN